MVAPDDLETARHSKGDKSIRVSRLGTGGLACGLALLLATACTSRSGLATGGPFGNGNTGPVTVCDWTRPGGVVYDGYEAFHNTGGTATIEKVGLVHPRNLRLVAAWVVPIPVGAPIIGIGQGYPSASGLASTAPGVQWGRRQHVPGAVVRHTGSHRLVNLVLVVKPSGKRGTAKPIDMYYEAGGKHYLLHLPHGLYIWVGRTC